MPLRNLAGLALALFLTSSAPAIDPKYLPPNTEAAITINIKALLDSELAKTKKDLITQFKTMVKDKLAETPAKEYFDKAGFDVFKDLHSITIATDGTKDEDALFIAVEGTFDTPKLADAARAAGQAEGTAVKVSKTGSVTLFEIKKGEEKTIYAGLANDRLLMVAPTREGLNATITRVNGGRVANINPTLKSLLATTNPKQTLSIVATGQAISKGMERAPRGIGQQNLPFQAGDLEGFTMSVTVARDIGFQVGVNSRDEDGAKKMAAMFNFGLLTVRGMIAQKAQEDAKAQPIVDIANTLRVTNQGVNVILRGEVTLENLDRLLALVPR